MNVVLISDCGPFDVYLAQQLRGRWPQTQILRVGPPPRGLTPARRRKLLRSPFSTGLRYAEQLLYYRGYRQRLARQVSQRLFARDVPPPLEGAIDIANAELNSHATRALLERLAPDVLVVSSAPLLDEAIYSTARLAAVNIHRGIAPNYRGDSTLFWPLYHANYDQLGLTIHHLDPGIDTGRILAQAFLPLQPRETEASLLAAAAPLAAELLQRVIAAAASRPPGQATTGTGRLFRARDRRLWHDASLWLRHGIRREKIRPRPSRIVDYLSADVG